tara:strand:+ start:39 stop:992 length:954 start_codon:yes stop_codon:yes gene_type:complete
MINFSKKQNIYSQLLFIDGLNRSGKSIFSGLLSQYKDVEQIKFKMIFEHLFPSYILGKIDKKTCESIIVSQLNEISYNSLIGRDLNFRKKDQSSIYNHINHKNYIKRIESDEKMNKNLKILKSNKIIFPYQTHDFMVYWNKIQKINLNCKIIEIFRNPFDNLYSWFQENLHNRFINDPRVYTLNIKYMSKEYPWYYGLDKSLLRMRSNIYDQTVSVFIYLLKKSIKNIKKFKNNNIHIVYFDELVTQPDEELLKISHFLNKEFKKNKKKYLENKIPRKIDEKIQKNKKDYIRKICCKNLYNEMVRLESDYKENKYGI